MFQERAPIRVRTLEGCHRFSDTLSACGLNARVVQSDKATLEADYFSSRCSICSTSFSGWVS